MTVSIAAALLLVGYFAAVNVVYLGTSPPIWLFLAAPLFVPLGWLLDDKLGWSGARGGA